MFSKMPKVKGDADDVVLLESGYTRKRRAPDNKSLFSRASGHGRARSPPRKVAVVSRNRPVTLAKSTYKSFTPIAIRATNPTWHVDEINRLRTIIRSDAAVVNRCRDAFHATQTWVQQVSSVLWNPRGAWCFVLSADDARAILNKSTRASEVIGEPRWGLAESIMTSANFDSQMREEIKTLDGYSMSSELCIIVEVDGATISFVAPIRIE
jgi:hypothetical protein